MDLLSDDGDRLLRYSIAGLEFERRGLSVPLRCSVYHGTLFWVRTDWRFYTTYRLLPWIKESVVVIGSPGSGAFYDESDPGFEKPENRKQMTLLRQGRRDCLYLDAIFKVSENPNLHSPHTPFAFCFLGVC